jgi:hypothetical protein
VPEGGTEMVAVEKAAELPGDGGGPAEAEWAKVKAAKRTTKT